MSESKDNNYNLSLFQRNRYFYGKLMTVKDFDTEQNYMNEKRHLLNRMIGGAGIICGLGVEDVEISVIDGNVRIKFKTGGVAVDSWGREIVIPVEDTPREIFLKEGSTKSNLTDSLVSGDRYYLYLEYDPQEGEMVSSALENSSCEETCCPNRVIENFEVIASTDEPESRAFSCPSFASEPSEEEAKQKVKDWLMEQTADFCEAPDEGKIFFLALSQGSSPVTVDETETNKYLTFVTHNSAFSDLMACHLSDFGNPHKNLEGVEVEGTKVDHINGYITIEKDDAITLDPDQGSHTITIGESHSARRDNPHEVKMSQLQDFDAADNKIFNVSTPTEDKDAANKKYVDDNDTRVQEHSDQGDEELKESLDSHGNNSENPHAVKMSQLNDFSANNNSIEDVLEPEGENDAANKKYVDDNDARVQAYSDQRDEELRELLDSHVNNSENPHAVKMSQLNDFSANNRNIEDVLDPAGESDAANKKYVDDNDTRVQEYSDQKDEELRESLNVHLSDLGNPHQNLEGFEMHGIKVDHINGYITIEKDDAITLEPDQGNHTITIGEAHSGRTGNPHQTKHQEIVEVLPVDPTDDDTVRNKHVSNEDAKRWDNAAALGGLVRIDGVENLGGNVDLIPMNSIVITPDDDANTITIGETHSARRTNPHETTAEQVGALVGVGGIKNPGGFVNLVETDSIVITPDGETNTITIGETHSARTDNPHNAKMSQLGDFNANGHNITEVSDPVGNKDAANKLYVDAQMMEVIRNSDSKDSELRDYINQKAGGSISSPKDIIDTTTDYSRQINVSINSNAVGGDYSQVNASDTSTASGHKSQVNASALSTASSQNSQVNASTFSSANHDYTQINASWGVATGNAYTVCGGYGGGEEPLPNEPSPANRTWEINSITGEITHTGSINSQASFADYGEYFENLTKKEIDMGVLIALEGAHVRPARKDEDFIGVVSGTAAVRLGDSPFCWQGRYLKDEWGRPVYKTIKDPTWKPKTAPDKKWKPKKGQTEADRPMIPVESEKNRPNLRVMQENPDYDPLKKQRSRAERPDEWTLVGLLGQVYVRCDDSVKPGDFVKSSRKGIGTASAEKTRLKAMKITKAFDNKYSIVYCLLV